MVEQRVGQHFDGLVGPKTDARPLSHVTAISQVEDAFRHLDPAKLYPLLDSISDGFSGKNGAKRAQVLGNLFDTQAKRGHEQNASVFTARLQDDLIDTRELPHILDDPSVNDLVRTMLPQRDAFGLQLGVILTYVPLNRMDEDIQAAFAHAKPVDYTILRGHTNWRLCNAAEKRLAQSVHLGAVTRVGNEQDNQFLMKYKGVNTALCLQDMVNPDGQVLLRGNWYSPHDMPTRQVIRNAYDAGNGKIALTSGTWALMRPSNFYMDSTSPSMIEVDKVVAQLPERFPPMIEVGDSSFTRKAYRQSLFEDHKISL